MSEMLERSILQGPRPWKARIHIKHLLSGETDLTAEQYSALGLSIARVLEAHPLFEDSDVINGLSDVSSEDELNALLDAMYDECDRARILVQ